MKEEYACLSKRPIVHASPLMVFVDASGRVFRGAPPVRVDFATRQLEIIPDLPDEENL